MRKKEVVPKEEKIHMRGRGGAGGPCAYKVDMLDADPGKLDLITIH